MQNRLRSQLRITWHLPAILGVLVVLAGGALTWNWAAAPAPRVIRLHGSHREIGLQHGRLLRHEIRALYDAYVVHGIVEKEGHSLESLLATAHHYDARIPKALREEMHGIADGARVPYDEILVMNTFADALLGRNRFCSAVAVHGKDGLLVGRNLDWVNHGVAHRSGVVFVLEPTGERSVLSVGWPGIAGVVTGMNDRGVTVSLNMAFGGKDGDGTPALLRIRDALSRATTAQDVVATATREPRTMAMNWMVTSGDEDRALVLEMTGDEYAVRPMDRGCAVTTNHFEALPIHGGAGSDRTSLLRSRFADHPSATVSEIERALLRVAFLGPPEGLLTVQSVVFEPKSRVAHVAIGRIPAPSGRFYEVRLLQ
ncbi:MAG: hypothetical protein JOZ54_08840 [Acidobacteria bacterium]|nr:hypothetical protein [Acidobacteriota bacterium]